MGPGMGPGMGMGSRPPSGPGLAPREQAVSAGPGGAMGGAPGGVGPLARAAKPDERPAATPPPAAWTALEAIEPDDRLMTRNRLVSWKKSDPAYVAFDVLRTRMGGLLRDKGWKRVAVGGLP